MPMKTKIALLVLFLVLLNDSSIAQTADRKAEKERQRVAREAEVARLVESGTFGFSANRALPSGYPSVDLTTNPNFIRFSPDLVVSEMPFLGNAYSASYGGEAGLKFEGKPERFTVEKKRKSYQIEAKIRSSKDFYSVSLSVSFNGSASLTISSNNKATISYNGEILPGSSE